MNVKIHIATKDVGNPRRGYHNTDVTIVFDYDNLESVQWTEEREREIVEGIFPNNSMWYTLKKQQSHVWELNYGYDSSD